MSLTNQEALQLHSVIGRYMGRQDLPGKFSYALMRTMKNIKPVVDTMNELRKPVEGYDKFETDRVALCESYADRAPELGEDGKPVKNNENKAVLTDKPHIQNNQYVIKPDSMKELNEKLDELKASEAHAETIKLVESREKEVQDMLSLDSEVEAFTCSSEFIPDNISPNELTILEVLFADK